ncbi:MAG TPA: DUF4397 domain-containing protein [Aggregatilinea sp.]|uniref:DUF4397 domain-containing protein n=1 Tax=Aggregatilinea sp. TaxID=2806333 RepID=UPI002B8F60A0|nr:DUF4397 domain-containing protein [Aggregatilinea sp.]HML23891.1 DUF4397 domain-containing protein [Aggregatilinea sp.]
MNRRTWVLTGLLLAALTLTLVGAFTPSTAHAQDGSSRLRFLHAVPGGPAIDVYVDGALVAPNLSYSAVTPHLTFTAGAHDIALREAGADPSSAPLATAQVSLVPDLAFMLVMQGTPDAITTMQYEDILDPIETGMARLTAINTIADAPALDVLTAEGGPLLQGVSYNVQYGTINIPASVQNLVMVPAGGDVDSAVASVGEVHLVSGTLYTFVILGTLDGDVTPTTLILATPVNSPLETESVRVRLAHASPDVPTVDVYANDVLIAPSLDLGQMTDHVALPAGATSLVLRNAGAAATDDPLVTADVTLDAATPAVTVAVVGQVASDGPTIQVYPDNTADVAPENARIAVLNTVPGATTTVTLSGEEEVTLASGLTTDTQADAVDAAPSQYALSASVEGGESPASVTVPEQPYFGGVYYTVLVYGTMDTAAAQVAGTEIQVTANSLPGGSAAVVSQPVATEAAPVVTEAAAEPPAQATDATPVPAEGAAEPTEAAPAQPAQPQRTGPIGYVEVNAGSNLHCRQYPNSNSLSLGLIPSGAQLGILGRIAPPTGAAAGTAEAEPAPEATLAITDITDIWLWSEWIDPAAGTMQCWVSAGFVRVENNGQTLASIESLMALPPIPSDRAGEVIAPGTGVTPVQPTEAPAAEQPAQDTPAPADNAAPVSGPTGTIVLDPGVNLNLRSQPNADAGVLRAVAGGATVTVTGRNADGSWLYVTYIDESGSVEGWAVAQYISVTENGAAYDVMQLPDVSAGAPAAPAATPLAVG